MHCRHIHAITIMLFLCYNIFEQCYANLSHGCLEWSSRVWTGWNVVRGGRGGAKVKEKGTTSRPTEIILFIAVLHQKQCDSGITNICIRFLWVNVFVLWRLCVGLLICVGVLVCVCHATWMSPAATWVSHCDMISEPVSRNVASPFSLLYNDSAASLLHHFSSDVSLALPLFTELSDSWYKSFRNSILLILECLKLVEIIVTKIVEKLINQGTYHQQNRQIFGSNPQGRRLCESSEKEGRVSSFLCAMKIGRIYTFLFLWNEFCCT